MAWEPITVTEELLERFARSAASFCDQLDERDKRLWTAIIERAGGDDDGSPSEPATGRYGEGNDSSTSVEQSSQRILNMLRSVWEPDTTIAPLYSGAMPHTGSLD